MPNDTQPEKPKIAEEVWAIFCGDIDANNTARFAKALASAGANGTKRAHILFQSWGGYVGDGVFLYNSLKSLGIEVILYNAGQVASAATLAYLGAHGRKTTANAIFMIHKAASNPNASGVGKLKAVANNLDLDDGRVESILRTHLRLPEEMWTQFAYHDVYLSGADAVEYGMADEIAEFSPPVGVKVLNAVG